LMNAKKAEWDRLKGKLEGEKTVASKVWVAYPRRWRWQCRLDISIHCF
jgi:hypothetical protein